MPMRAFPHTVTPEDTAAEIGSGDLDVLATPRLITWCERAAFEVCKQNVDSDHTTVGTTIKMEHIKGSPVGAAITVNCAEPINDGRRLVCHVTVTDAEGDELARGEVHRAVVDPDRFMSKCHKPVH
ncbi:thioesterase family protein [Terracoccus luteus]|uniref:Putative thioesterase n=1 Tax=Terracoccus luteus TaxID=53356 RepID=A0A839PS82_9MICO|nr:thioesterase [Terracoccus luteus]MBB2987040.1 putative thioesterase [Terracoccus luteus]MCP2172691.1 putative thioesterase [Terracoccus luteus]